jgi:hypothetical protein
MLTRLVSVIGAVAFAVIALPLQLTAQTPTPAYPAQNCGTGTSGKATIIAYLPTFKNSTTNTGRNSIVGFVYAPTKYQDQAGEQYFAALQSVARGPVPPPSSPTPIPTNLQPPTIDTSALSHTMQFANEAPNYTFTCTNLTPGYTYRFVATMFVDTPIPTSVSCPTQQYTTLQTAYYFDTKLVAPPNNSSRIYRNPSWTFDGTNPPTPQVGTSPIPTPQPC